MAYKEVSRVEIAEAIRHWASFGRTAVSQRLPTFRKHSQRPFAGWERWSGLTSFGPLR